MNSDTYIKTINRILEQEIETGRMKGNSALIIHNGKEIYYDNFGYANAETKAPMGRDTIIRLYSMSKPITAAATMIAQEMGLIDLQHPVSLYLPEYADMDVLDNDGTLHKATAPITLKHLITMTSGIPYGENWEGCSKAGLKMQELFDSLLDDMKNGKHISTREMVSRIAKMPLAFNPGKQWMYGLSADILGAVIEVASGMKYSDFLKKYLFDPLEMKDTSFYVPKEKKDRFAMSYEWEKEGGPLYPCDESHLCEHYDEDVLFESGGAGLTSTIDDYSHFASMLVNGGVYNGKRILGSHSVRFMATNHLTAEQSSGLDWDSNMGYGYGALMRVHINQFKSASQAPLGEFGWDGWTGNYVSMDPDNNLVILFFMQRRGAGTVPAIRKIRAATYGIIDEL